MAFLNDFQAISIVWSTI